MRRLLENSVGNAFVIDDDREVKMGFKFSDYYNAENICLSEENIRELLIAYLEKGEEENDLY